MIVVPRLLALARIVAATRKNHPRHPALQRFYQTRRRIISISNPLPWHLGVLAVNLFPSNPQSSILHDPQFTNPRDSRRRQNPGHRPQSITSWNNLNSTMWSDGWRFGPFMADEPLLLKSPDENLLFWEDHWERVGSISKFINQRFLMNWRNPKRAVKPSEADYLHALESGMATKKQQIHYIRKRLWWKANDHSRQFSISH